MTPRLVLGGLVFGFALLVSVRRLIPPSAWEVALILGLVVGLVLLASVDPQLDGPPPTLVDDVVVGP